MNKVYIIIVNYNKFGDTIECLESVLKSEYTNFQTFVVDNSSDNSSIEQLSNWISNNNYTGIESTFKDLVFPLAAKPVDHVIIDESTFNSSSKLFENKITIIRSENRGFAAANNIVLRYILKNGLDSSLIWILNNDTVVEKNTLSNLIAAYQYHGNSKYILGTKLRYYDKPEVLQAVAGKYNKWVGEHKHIGDGEVDRGQYDGYVPGEMDYIVGASVFLPRLFIEEAGIMCEDYFLYFEELDWMKTGLKYGFTMALAPQAIVYHKEGSSIIEYRDKKKDISTAEYYSITNRVRFIKKWYPYCLTTVMLGVIWALLKRTLKGKFSLVKKISVTVVKILFE